MRWLMRSGDADRIATFAAATRDRAAQLMAADYLRRHADWRSRPDLTRHILHFYTRAKAYGKLAAFYAECAKVEVDEYEVSIGFIWNRIQHCDVSYMRAMANSLLTPQSKAWGRGRCSSMT